MGPASTRAGPKYLLHHNLPLGYECSWKNINRDSQDDSGPIFRLKNFSYLTRMNLGEYRKIEFCKLDNPAISRYVQRRIEENMNCLVNYSKSYA